MSRGARALAVAYVLLVCGPTATAQGPAASSGFVLRFAARPEPTRLELDGWIVCVEHDVIPPRPTTRFPEAQQAEMPAAAQDDPTRDRRRILTLADGTTLRGKSRRADSGWERRVDRAWVPVDGTVVRARLEKDVVAEARRRAPKVGRNAHEERVALARWMLAEGLDAEALDELDRVLAKEPRHAGALALIAAEPIELPLGLPADAPPGLVLDETLKAGARGTPAVREVAAVQVARWSGSLDGRALVLAELKRPQPTRRAFATLLAQGLYPNELLPELARRALLDPMQDVRRAATAALREADTPTVVDPLASGLASRHHVVRAHAVEALGLVGQPAAAAPLMTNLAALQAAGGTSAGVRGNLFVGLQTALVTDYDVEIAQAASIGDPVVTIQESGVVHDARAQAQIDRRVELRLTVAALADATGERARSAEAWLEWWRTEGDAWLAAKGAPPRAKEAWTPPAAPATGAARR